MYVNLYGKIIGGPNKLRILQISQNIDGFNELGNFETFDNSKGYNILI